MTEPQTTSSPLMDAALAYAERMGWRVFPLHNAPDGKCSCGDSKCHSPGKHPRTANGVKNASSNLEQVKIWWNRWPNANIGGACDSNSFDVVDIDSPDAQAAFEALQHDHGFIPDTLTQATGRGRHHMFKCGVLPNSTSRIAPGIDTKGSAISKEQYVVLSPSIHPNGKTYTWIDREPGAIEIADCPEWLIKMAHGDTNGNGKSKKAAPSNKADGGDSTFKGEKDSGRNAFLISMTGRLRRQGDSEDMILQALLLRNSHFESPLEDAEVAGIAKSGSRYEPADSAPRAHLITIEGGKLPEIVDAGETALLATAEHGIYQRGGLLVRTIELPTMVNEDGIKREAGALQIVSIEMAYLRETLTKCASWQKYDGRAKGYVATDCPKDIAITYMARAGHWNVSVLTGIIEAPTICTDGRVIQTPGYDPQSGLLLRTAETFPTVPDSPSKDDALAALEILGHPIREFPFDKPEDKSVVFAAILTVLVRQSLPAAPMFGFSAPVMGSGKSLLADVVTLIGTGRNGAAMSQPTDGEEDQKRLLSLLMAGDPVAVMDNVEHPIQGAALCSVLTQDRYKGRILGISKNVEVSTRTTFLATGNNLTFRGDMASRALLCTIDPGMENPEERPFEGNLRQEVLAARGTLVCAALTILRAYHVAGRPKMEIKQFGRFEDWSNLVRSALVWLREADPNDTRKKIKQGNIIQAQLAAVVEAWRPLLGTSPRTAQQLWNFANQEQSSEEVEALRAALVEVGDEGKGFSTKKLGKWFAKFENRRAGNLRIAKMGDHRRSTLWAVLTDDEEGVEEEDSENEQV